jgi:hypothetical protein
MSKRILGATLVGLNTTRRKLVQILVRLTQISKPSHPLLYGSSVATGEKIGASEMRKQDQEEQHEQHELMMEAEKLLKAADEMHTYQKQCLEHLLSGN